MTSNTPPVPGGTYWRVRYRPGGWIRLEAPPGGLPNGFRGIVYLQVKPHAPLGDRLLVHNAVMAGQAPISARTWRQVPLADVEALAMNPETAELLSQPGQSTLSLIDDLDRYYAESEDQYAGWSDSIPFGAPMLPTDVPVIEDPLKPPAGRITDDFLAHVASAYGRMVGLGLPPAPALAEEAGVPVRTVHGWISQARKRGNLPPGRPGRAG